MGLMEYIKIFIWDGALMNGNGGGGGIEVELELLLSPLKLV